MATPGKKVTNQAAIAAAQAANAAAASAAAAAQARAAAADAARRPVLQQTVAGIGGINKALQTSLAALTNPKSSQAAIDKALAESKAALAAQKTNLATITPEQRQMAIEQGQIYTSAMSDVEKYNAMMVSVPGAIYEEEPTTGNLSLDAFINTLTLLMGKEEASKAYVKELYGLVSRFYKQGSTISDSINLALYQAKEEKAIPEFTNRFSGIFALQERRARGEAIDVPTIAEYVKSQERLGEILRRSALTDLANETFLNTVMGTGKSVDESVSIITDVFDLIDNAPTVFKAQLAKTFPTVTRAQLAQALLTGPEGVKQLQKTVSRAGVIAAGTAQGLQISEALASDLVSKGQTFGTAGAGFLKTAQILPVAQKLTSMETGIEPTQAYTTEQAVAATFDQSAAELQRLADLAEREGARFASRSGTAGSRSLASQSRGLLA